MRVGNVERRKVTGILTDEWWVQRHGGVVV